MPRNWISGQLGALRLGNIFWPVWLAASSLTLGMLWGEMFMFILFPTNAVAVFQIYLEMYGVELQSERGADSSWLGLTTLYERGSLDQLLTGIHGTD